MVRKSISLAQQIIDEILAGIRDGTLPREGGWLPSEAELGSQFGVSRATVREALSRLEQAGLIVRKHGVGTQVVPQPPVIDTGLEELVSLETMAQRIGLETNMGRAVIEERGATAAEAGQLRLAPAAPVLSVARVIMTGKRPVAYLIDVVPTTYLRREDLGADFRGSVLDLLIQRGVGLSHSRTAISAEAADDEIARKLRLQVDEALLKLEAQLYTSEGAIVDYSTSYFVPGYFHFHVVRRVGVSGDVQLKTR
jgi:GntR family transcriptional regulator